MLGTRALTRVEQNSHVDRCHSRFPQIHTPSPDRRLCLTNERAKRFIRVSIALIYTLELALALAPYRDNGRPGHYQRRHMQSSRRPEVRTPEATSWTLEAGRWKTRTLGRLSRSPRRSHRHAEASYDGLWSRNGASQTVYQMEIVYPTYSSWRLTLLTLATPSLGRSSQLKPLGSTYPCRHSTIKWSI